MIVEGHLCRRHSMLAETMLQEASIKLLLTIVDIYLWTYT